MKHPNISISRKRRLYWDNFEKNVICVYLRNYQHVGVKHVFGDHFEKIVFCSWICKYQYFEEMKGYIEIILKKTFFDNIAENIKIRRKCDLFEEYVQKYQYFVKNYDILRPLSKIDFCPNIRIYQHFDENDVSWDYFEKSFFVNITVIISIFFMNP